jgi:hypothetical protein
MKRQVMRRAESTRRAAANSSKSYAALSGKWPDPGRSSELRTDPGHDDATHFLRPRPRIMGSVFRGGNHSRVRCVFTLTGDLHITLVSCKSVKLVASYQQA